MSRTGARAASHRKPSVGRGRLGAVMFGTLAVGMVLMLVFESPITRVVGVLALFAFIVSGVFLIADPAFLGQDDDSELPDDRRPG